MSEIYTCPRCYSQQQPQDSASQPICYDCLFAMVLTPMALWPRWVPEQNRLDLLPLKYPPERKIETIDGLTYEVYDQVITSQHFYIVEPGQPPKLWPDTGRCECGREFDTKWPGDSGADVCQTCWERQSSAAWWRTHGGLYRDPGPGGKL